MAHAFFPPPAGGTYAGHLHFDDDESWSSDGTGIDLETVALHEIGHLLGIMHSNDPTAIMYATYTVENRFLSSDDIAAIHALYGEYVGIFDIRSGKITDGDMPKTAQDLVEVWIKLHGTELIKMWETQTIRKLPPL